MDPGLWIYFLSASSVWINYFSCDWDFRPRNDLFCPLNDPGWRWEAHHRFQINFPIGPCISCEFGYVSDFWPRNDLFWPLRWPRMTSKCASLNSEENFQSIYMHIWPEIKILPLILLWPLVTSNVWLWPFDLLKWPNQTQIRILRAVKVLHHPSKFWNSIKKISRLYTNNAFFYL